MVLTRWVDRSGQRIAISDQDGCGHSRPQTGRAMLATLHGWSNIQIHIYTDPISSCVWALLASCAQRGRRGRGGLGAAQAEAQGPNPPT